MDDHRTAANGGRRLWITDDEESTPRRDEAAGSVDRGLLLGGLPGSGRSGLASLLVALAVTRGGLRPLILADLMEGTDDDADAGR